MGIFKQARASVHASNARRALEEGRTVFLAQIGSSIKADAVSGVAEDIEAVEAEGWRLDQMSYVWSTTLSNHPVGFFLFRRA